MGKLSAESSSTSQGMLIIGLHLHDEGISVSFSICLCLSLSSAAVILLTLFPFSVVLWTRAIFSMGNGESMLGVISSPPYQIDIRMIDYVMFGVKKNEKRRERKPKKSQTILCHQLFFHWSIPFFSFCFVSASLSSLVVIVKTH